MLILVSTSGLMAALTALTQLTLLSTPPVQKQAVTYLISLATTAQRERRKTQPQQSKPIPRRLLREISQLQPHNQPGRNRRHMLITSAQQR